FSRDSIINTGLIFFALMILSTALFGRYFCGWACHLLALQDLCRHWMLKLGIRPRPLRSRVLAWVPTAAFLYMFIWPLVYRWWVGDSLAVRGMELTTAHFWATFPGWIVGALTFLICGFACVYFLGAKGFCTYACPYGAAFAAVDRLAPWRIRVTDACQQCGHCTAVCSSNVRVHEEVRDWGMVVSPGCMKCNDCVSVCPTGALYYGVGTIPLLARRRQPATRSARPAWRWGEELALLLLFGLTFLIVRGLYGVVPFLMSLGVAGVVAFLGLQTWRLLRGEQIDRAGFRLRGADGWRPAGRLWLAGMAVLIALLLHSAVLRWQMATADAAVQSLLPARLALLANPGQTPSLSDAEQAAAESAIEALQRVDRWGLFPTLGNAAKQAWMQVLIDQPEAALAQADAAVANDELSEQMWQLRAHIALQRHELEAALAAWQQAIDARPDLPEAYLAMGIGLAGQGQLIQAQAVFDRGLAAVGETPELLYNAGLARALSGQLGASLNFFERALVLRPVYQEARENLAGVHAELGQFDAAAAQFRIAAEQMPDDADTWFLLARASAAAGQRAQALEALDRVLQLQPDHSAALQFRTELALP
ncbi:MAG: tetratricopeptide repeat protein, partial [Xanthomonadales bacterium]|nr:tetratricopeptide repeat protein [Xanthomonadales bacterium]